MSKASDKSEQDKWRGLPVDWGWRPRHQYSTAAVCDLFRDGADVGEEVATAWADGTWKCWSATAGVVAFGHAADNTAAQREAEAALWRVDGFGVGEVRGRLVDALDTVKPFMVFPGIGGLWRVTGTRVTPEGVEVDARRSPFATVADIDAAWAMVGAPVAEPASLPCPSGAGAHNRALLAGHRCAARGVARQDAEEPACVDGDHHPLDPRPANGSGPAPREPSAPTASMWARAAEMQGEPLPLREPPVPADDASALPLPLAVEGITPEHEARLDAVIAACTEGEPFDWQAEIDRLRARAAELEAERARHLTMIGRVTAELDLERGVNSLSDEAALRARLATLEATPPPGTVAALLLKVEEARKTALDARDEYPGHSVGYGEHEGEAYAYGHAADMIRAELATGAPTDLDRAVGEVLARAKGFADQRYPGAWLDLARETADAQDGNHRENAIECAGLCLRALLACDAPLSDATKEPG